MRKREPYLKATYNITAEDFESMLEAQGGVCAICEQEDPRFREDGTRYPLSVDHDHASSQVRLLLCGACNAGLGLFQDDPELLLRAAEYLRLHTPKSALVKSTLRT